jgi:catechol 2,3-dioxygenase-like lactoylglutathione lyase family enzyme
MALWNGRLTELLMTARDPAAAASHWAGLLGGEAVDSGLVLGGHTRIVIAEGPAEALAEMHFDAGSEMVAAAQSAGATTQADGSSTLTDPDGWLLCFHHVADVEPLEVDSPTLSHCTLGSPSPPGQRGYYESLLFLLSDQLGEIFCWLRPNPIHHSVAFSASSDANIHHIAVELPDRSAFIGAIDRVVAQGGKLEFGPGRHMVGGNLFAYLRDDYGIRWELCAEMGRLDPDRPPGLLTAEDRKRSVNTFGPPPPESFIKEPGGPPPAASAASPTAAALEIDP